MAFWDEFSLVLEIPIILTRNNFVVYKRNEASFNLPEKWK